MVHLSDSSHPCSTTNITGFNVPIAITPTGGTGKKCTKVTCGATTDLLTKCDPALAFPFGSDTVCMPPCRALILQADPAGSCFNPCTAGVQYRMLFCIIFRDPADIVKKLVPRYHSISRLPSHVVPIIARRHARPIPMSVSEHHLPDKTEI
jgi:hypothetical protein